MTADVDRTCIDLEEACYGLIARQAPVDGDLRRVAHFLTGQRPDPS